ncbi:hypothetical protein [Mycobacterium kubicae]|uniref:hypothetical protein n=1 Tax=Mycobacterium kubicae TaxID=120959 RepID=UPI000A7DBC1D|nr:hypothetical protein [Mycobacterium kubicae]
MTDTAPTTTGTRTNKLYHALAITGIAVGIFVVVAGVYLLFFAPSDCCGGMKAVKQDCCAAMKDDMKNMKMPMGPTMPSMSPMPSMPPSNMPMPTPGR